MQRDFYLFFVKVSKLNLLPEFMSPEFKKSGTSLRVDFIKTAKY